MITPLPGWKLRADGRGVEQDGTPINLGSTALGAFNSPYPPQSSNVRDLQIRGGDPASIVQSSANQAQGVAHGAAPQFDGNAIIALLQKYQKQALNQGMNAQQQQIDAGQAQTPDSLIGASPSLQNQVRNAEQGTFNPTIQGANSTDVLLRDQVGEINRLMEQQAKEKERVARQIKDNIDSFISRNNVDALKALSPETYKLAGYDEKTIRGLISGIERDIAEERRQFDVRNAPKGVGGSGGLTGPNGKPLRLTAPQVDTLTGFETTIQSAQKALDILTQGAQSGPVSGRVLWAKKLFDAQDPNQLALEQILAKIKADFMKAISGAAVSESEAVRLAAFLPTITDQEGVIEAKLNNLITESQRGRINLLGTLGAVGDTTDTAREAIIAAGYNYDAIKKDHPNVSDEQIREDLGL